MYNKMLAKIKSIWPILMVLLLHGAAVSQEQLEVKAMFPEANAITIYKLQFILADTLNTDSHIKIVFPADFDLTKVKMAGSSTINGGFKVTVDDSTVILKRSGLGNVISPGKKVDVKFANVKNPPTPDKLYNIKVEILNGNVKLIEKKIDVKILAEKAK